MGSTGALFGLIGALFGDFIQNYKSIIYGRMLYFLQLFLSSVIGFAIGLFPMARARRPFASVCACLTLRRWTTSPTWLAGSRACSRARPCSTVRPDRSIARIHAPLCGERDARRPAGGVRDSSGERVTAWYNLPLVVLAVILLAALYIVCESRAGSRAPRRSRQ